MAKKLGRSPNSEQSIAINKIDGAILSAGAGSGKTFVIIEHIIHLIEKKRAETQNINLEIEIPQFISKLVLMTFTKKAAGEMLVRLVNRIEEKILEDENSSFWELVLRNISLMQVSTIHGFCHRLISLNIWPDLPANIDLLSPLAHENKIKKLSSLWFEKNKNQLDELYLSQTSDLYAAMLEIFASPELRVMWEKGQQKKNLNDEIDSFFKAYLDLVSFPHIFNVDNFKIYTSSDVTKPAFELLNNWQKLLASSGAPNAKNLNNYYNIFSAFKTFPREVKDMDETECVLREEIKSFNDILKKIKTDYMGLVEHFDKYVQWETVLFDMFNYVNQNYLTLPGFSFSDLEYYVYKGLEKDSARLEVAKRYQYFIVDEFQDTSFLQFDIIKKCINENKSRLFCVGDKKQAIYGFRGGELQVFADCQLLMGKDSNLSLLSNYRSEDEVINFNNELFEHVLPIGIGYEGLDSHSVEMEKQIAPLGKKLGAIHQYQVENNNDELELDQVEGLAIVQIVEKLHADPSLESIAILYRKLKPSHLVIDLLKNKNLAFSAQIKIGHDNDPIINLFLHFTRCLVNKDDMKRFNNSCFYIKGLLAVLNVEFKKEVLDVFVKNAPFIGLYHSFVKAIVDLTISNSLYEENLKLIEEICRFTKNEPLLILRMIGKSDGNYSFEMITGANKKIYILSAHASKGLEYDAVILGGIHTNGRYEGMSKKIGSMPKSFKWKYSFDQKSYFKSLNYYIESEIQKLKDFSESKRLFYVACTRAVKKLCFVNITQNGKPGVSSSNSWINGIRSFPYSNYLVEQLVLDENVKINPEVNYILKDNLGVLSTSEKSTLGIISELSVTRLATIAECPFKFYLKNICKLEATPQINFDQEEDEEVFYSSKDRGSAVHYQISQSILKENFKIKVEYQSIIDWVRGELNKCNPVDLISEKEIKFSFFGQMITAIPDLVIVKENEFEIWDFKTGRQDLESEKSYWFQLKAYALGIYKLNQNYQMNNCVLKLVYVDELKVETKTINFSTVKNDLYQEWMKTDNFTQINSSHCTHCDYSYMCKFSSAVESH